MKRVLGMILTLCMLLTLVPMTAVQAVPVTDIYVFNAEDFYNEFECVDGVVTIPKNVYAHIYADALNIDDKIVVSPSASLIVEGYSILIADIKNNGTVTVMPSGTLMINNAFENNQLLAVMPCGMIVSSGDTPLVNSGTFSLDGYYVCGVIGTEKKTDVQTYTYSGAGTVMGGATAAVVAGSADDHLHVDFTAAVQDLGAIFENVEIFAWAGNFSDLKAFNENEAITSIYVEPRDGGEIFPVQEDITISKRLCVGPCDLLVQNGVTLTVKDYENKVLMRDKARIVVEAAGAASPDAPAGGTLVLNDTALLSGDADKGAINPTRDISWVTSFLHDEYQAYPAPANAVVIGGWSEADAHGDITALENMDVVMEDRDSRLRLTGDFACGRIGINGELNLCDHTLTANEVYYANEARIDYGEGKIEGTPCYQVRVDTVVAGDYESVGVPVGERLYLEFLGVRFEDFADDDSFVGWRFESGWDVPREELDALAVILDDDKESEDYGRHYIVAPAFPIEIRAEWKTERVSLPAKDATIAFEGIEGHEYELALYVDSVNTTVGELEAIGSTPEEVSALVGMLQGDLGEEDKLLRLFAFKVTDGEDEARIDPYEYALPLDEKMKSYRYLSVLPVRKEGDRAFIDGESFNCRVEDDVLIAQFPDWPDAYIIVGSNTDPSVVSFVHLSLERPYSGLVTDTPHDGHGGWDWNGQQGMPHVDMGSVRGAYLNGAYWTLADDAAAPFVGEMENGVTYGLFIVVNAEFDRRFAENVSVVVDGATVELVDKHIRDEDGEADILYLICTFKPVPTGICLGDVDGDKEVTILDATYIQRQLADLNNPRFVDEAADADGDGDLTIVDATAIQRWLADFDDNYLIGMPIGWSENG